jgi:hypothetical protein
MTYCFTCASIPTVQVAKVNGLKRAASEDSDDSEEESDEEPPPKKKAKKRAGKLVGMRGVCQR